MLISNGYARTMSQYFVLEYVQIPQVHFVILGEFGQCVKCFVL